MMPKTTSQTEHNAKRSFWMPDSLYEGVRSYVSRHRNAPEDLTINQFVRDALEAHLHKAKGRKRGRA